MRCVMRVGQFAAALHGAEIIQRGGALAHARHQDVGRGDRVLDRQVDADAADRRHGMRGVADEQQAGAKPGIQPVHRHGQQLHVVPGREFVHPVAQKRREPHDVGAERLEPARVHLIDAALRDDEGALPVVVAVQHDEDAAGVDAAERLPGIVRRLRQAQPQHVHRRADDRRPRNRRASRSVEWRPSAAMISSASDLQRAVGTLRRHADHAVALADQAGRLGAASAAGRSDSASPRSARKSRKSHCGMKATNFAARRQVGEVGDLDVVVADLTRRACEPRCAAVRGTRPAGQVRASPAWWTDARCRRGSRAGNRRASPARRRRCRRAPAAGRASCRPARRRRCSSGS